MDLVFSGVVSYMVFTAINPNKPPTSSLADRPFGQCPVPVSGPQRFRGVQLLFWLAPLAILFSVAFDILSILYLEAPFRRGHHIPWPAGGDLAKFIAFNSVGLTCLLATAVNLRRVSRLDAATGAVLREYKEVFKIKRDALWALQSGYAKYFRVPQSEGLMSIEVWIEDGRVRMEFVFDDAELYADVKLALGRREIVHCDEVKSDDGNRIVTLSERIGANDVCIVHAVREYYRLLRVMRSLRGYRVWTGNPLPG